MYIGLTSSTTCETPMPDQPLHLAYRPTQLGDVIGQDHAVHALEHLLSSPGTAPHSYLFVGPSGVGKTSLARIVMQSMKCELTEIDAASNSGIDAMRETIAQLQYPGLTHRNRGLIIDEAHGLSKQAWDSLLKVIEEPPSHLYIALCTTLPGKVPETVASRCQTFTLRVLRESSLQQLLENVADRERLPCDDYVLQAIGQAAQGSARRALVLLANVSHCATLREAQPLLDNVAEEGAPEIIDLARLLVSGRLQWVEVVSTLRNTDTPAESIRIMLVAYITAVILKSDRRDSRLLHRLEHLSTPFNPTDKMAPLLLALDRCING